VVGELLKLINELCHRKEGTWKRFSKQRVASA
jgi:hypothetical protein